MIVIVSYSWLLMLYPEVNIGFDNIGGNEYAAVKESNAEELPTFSSRYRAVESPPHPCCEQAARPYENVPGTTQSASPDYETIAKPAEEPYESLSERIQYANSNVSPYESLQSGPNWDMFRLMVWEPRLSIWQYSKPGPTYCLCMLFEVLYQVAPPNRMEL